MYTYPQKEKTPFETILDLLNSHNNVFITGEAGTGKSYILKQLKDYYGRSFVVTGTTGISALNIGGCTIHSWAGVGCMNEPLDSLLASLFGNDLDICDESRIVFRIKKCKILAIDEISMLSAYELEYLDAYFKAVRNCDLPFGGIQVVFLGDFLQLPPVATKEDLEHYPRKSLFCFDSTVWYDLDFRTVFLKKIHRQDDVKFQNMLSRFRIGQILYEDMLDIVSCRCTDEDLLKNKLHLFSRKNQAEYYNEERLSELSTPVFEYKAFDDIPVPEDIEEKDIIKYKNKTWYNLDRDSQAQRNIKLKVGCRVMLLKNLDFSSGLINGACGEVLELASSYAIVKFDNGIIKQISRCLFEYSIEDIVVAKRFQLPLKLAYAITIHKSQGMTFDEIVVDCEKAFAPGQVYVALSRVKSLKGLYIKGFNPKKLFSNFKAISFYSKLQQYQFDDVKEELYKIY